MVERRKRRKCSDEEKIRIIAQARMSGVSVPEGTHRYDLNTNMVFKWIRDPWCNSGSDDELEVMSFLPWGRNPFTCTPTVPFPRLRQQSENT